METTLVPRTGIPCYFFPMGAPFNARGIILLTLTFLRSLVLLLRLRPSVTFATGGYVSVPIALAARILRVPLVLFLPDVVPGKAVALLAPLATKIAVANEAARQHLPPGRVVVTGYPVRDVFQREMDPLAARAAARERMVIAAGERVLCILGGSQGSRAINDAVGRHLPELLARYTVLHIAGEKRMGEAEAAAVNLPATLRLRYRLYPYLHDSDLVDALLASDLVVCRSGASTLGELPATGLPAILVPLPDPAVHQRENAEALAATGGAVVLDQADLERRLISEIAAILEDPQRRQQMSAAMRAAARPDAAVAIARLIESVTV